MTAAPMGAAPRSRSFASAGRAQIWVVLPLLALLLACGRGDVEEAPPAYAEPDPQLDPPRTPSGPDTTPAAVWSHLEESEFDRTWFLFPGTEELYPGTDPHGALLTTYVNGLALEALQRGAAALPIGSLLVKRNFAADSTFVSTTIMYKFAGYDPDHDDWYWLKRAADGAIEAEGRVESCQECHARSGSDYIRTARLGNPEPGL
ncbi:MAG: hypothetical protein KC645_09750 [Gemmatimonadetes bacterium]|nr:hypothetical protein [Gemmatimonadota bacterium]